MVAVPDIKSFKLQKEYDFIVLGCDGIFDKLSNRDVVNCVWYTVNNQQAPTIHEQCGRAIEFILKASVTRRTLDNITAVMVSFSNFKRLAFPSQTATGSGFKSSEASTPTSSTLFNPNGNYNHTKTSSSNFSTKDSAADDKAVEIEQEGKLNRAHHPQSFAGGSVSPSGVGSR